MTTDADTKRPASISNDSPRPARKIWKGRIEWLVSGTLLGAAYWMLVRPRMLNWGATPEEVRASLPGDDRLPEPDAESTMAISIDATTGAIWPWLRQLGQEQGGFYSHEWAENIFGLDIHNADRIVPEWQELSVGDTVRLGQADRFPDATLAVVAFEPERALVLQTPDEPTGWVWSFVLDPIDESTTRLLVRSRIRLPKNPVVRVAAQLVLDPVMSIMTHGMLRGIRSRAERLETAQPTTDASDRTAPS